MKLIAIAISSRFVHSVIPTISKAVVNEDSLISLTEQNNLENFLQ